MTVGDVRSFVGGSFLREFFEKCQDKENRYSIMECTTTCKHKCMVERFALVEIINDVVQ
jgi:hypothetical protein